MESDFKGLTREHLRCKTLPFLGSYRPKPNRQHKSTFPRQNRNDERRQKKERNVTLKKSQCIIDLFIDLLGLGGIISDVLDIFNLTLKPLTKYQKILFASSLASNLRKVLRNIIYTLVLYVDKLALIY